MQTARLPRVCSFRPSKPALSIRAMSSAVKKERVWDYPRPPACEPTPKRIRVYLKDVLIADTTNAYRILETTHPPTYYIPPQDVKMELLRQNTASSSFCEWKGRAVYYDVAACPGAAPVKQRVWAYPSPTGRYAALKDHLAFYASPFTCYVDEEKAEPQPGGFYGGWVTSDLEGPFKGAPGTMGW